MRSYRYFHLDVFTDRLFGGNQLAVFLDGRGLTPDEMQAIAKEMNFSVTTFVLPEAPARWDFEVKIFTPQRELPMAGHPVIGTAFALARAGVLSPGRNRVIFGLGVGPTAVSLTWTNNALSFAWMSQFAPTFRSVIADAGAVAALLRLPPAAVAGSGLPAQVVSCGVPVLLVPLATRHAVDNVVFDPDAYDTFSQAAGVEAMPVLAFSKESGPDRATVYSRCFAPHFGVNEDPATGGASGPLGCYLVHHRVVAPDRAGSMWSLQGVKMGRPSRIYIAVGLTGTEITSVYVGGVAVAAGEGTLYM
jgi:trans-2,3-dihydro-3-hydroxyanthranilate isomerase